MIGPFGHDLGGIAGSPCNTASVKMTSSGAPNGDSNVHFGVRECGCGRAVDGAGRHKNVLGLAAMGACVHAQRAADRAGDTAQNASPSIPASGRARDRVGPAAPARMARLNRDIPETAPEPDDHARDAAVADDQIGAQADNGHRQIGRHILQEIGEIGLVSRVKTKSGPGRQPETR